MKNRYFWVAQKTVKKGINLTMNQTVTKKEVKETGICERISRF